MADMLIAGTWRRGDRRAVIRSPFDGSPVDSVPIAGAAEVEEALVAAESGAAAMRKTSGHDRGKMLHEAAIRLRQRGEDFARTISREEGKTLAESRAEVGRAAETLELSGSEAKRLAGRGVPLHGAPDAGDRIGFTVREPCGIVVAISPFNFPLNLVTHKVGPALAGGN